MKEVWKPILNFEGYYEVSSLGRVRGVPRMILTRKGVLMKRGYRIKTPTLNNQGYYVVGLCDSKKRKSKYLHRLIAEAFIPNPEAKPCVDHINCNRSDNRIENLRWATPYENANNPNTKRRIAEKQREIAKTRQVGARPIIQLTLDGRFMALYSSIRSAASVVGCASSSISYACRHNVWEHMVLGYRWIYADRYYKYLKQLEDEKLL